MEIDFTNVADLAVGGIPVAVFVFVVVQALKWGGLLPTPTSVRVGVLVSAVIGGGVWAASSLFPEIGPYVQVFFTASVGTALAVVGYEGYDRFRNRGNTPPTS